MKSCSIKTSLWVARPLTLGSTWYAMTSSDSCCPSAPQPLIFISKTTLSELFFCCAGWFCILFIDCLYCKSNCNQQPSHVLNNSHTGRAMLLNRCMWPASWNLYLVQSTHHYVQMNHTIPAPWNIGGWEAMQMSLVHPWSTEGIYTRHSDRPLLETDCKPVPSKAINVLRP